MIIKLPVTITERTPLITNVDDGQPSIVRLPFTERTLVFPFTAYLFTSSARLETVHDAPPLITVIITVVLPLLLFVVVEVFVLVPTRNPANGFVRFRNVSSDLFAADPIDDTTAAETRTGREIILVVSVSSDSVPSVPVDFPKNALFKVTKFDIHEY